MPGVHVRGAEVKEATGHGTRLRFTVRLDRPTSRPASVFVSTADRTATAGRDYGCA